MALIDPFTGLKYGWSPITENFATDMDANLKTIGAVLQLTVQAKTVNDPASLTPVNGQAWIIGATPVGAWAGKAKQIAAYIAGAWAYIVPKAGWQAYIVAEDAFATYKGAGPTWANDASGSYSELNTQTGTAYTLVLADKGKTVETNNAAANAVTVPPNSAVAYPIGTIIHVRQLGTGQTTIAAGAGVTIRNTALTLKLSAQYSEALLHKRAADEWVIKGDLAAA